MRRIYLAFLLSIICVSGLCVLPVQASMIAFETSACSDEEKSAIIEKNNLEIIHDDSYKAGIQCFDVREDGVYALAFGAGANCRIYVYDPNGEFMYGYTFHSDGDFGIELYEDALGIYFIRGNTIATYDSLGTCIDVQKMAATKQNLIYTNKILDRAYKKVFEKEYILERDLDVGDSYSRFVVVNKDGERSVLFEAPVDHIASQIILLVAPIGFFALVIWGVWKKRAE